RARQGCGQRGRSALRGPLLLLVPEDLVLLGPHLLDEVRVGRGGDDLVELGAVVRDQADALDDDVVDEPSVAALVHPIVDRDLRRSEEHTSELQSRSDLVCRLLLEKKKKK